MLTGNIYITTDTNIIRNAATTHTIVFISGEIHELKPLINIVNGVEASILLPPYDAQVLELDNRMQEYEQIYFNHLNNNPIASAFIALIIRTLFNGKNIILYLTKDENEMAYSKYFLKFFKMLFGIDISYNQDPPRFDINYVGPVLRFMFIHDVLPAEEFLLLYPKNIRLDNDIIIKLTKILDPYLLEYNNNQYISYFENLRVNIRQSGAPLQSPFMKG